MSSFFNFIIAHASSGSDNLCTHPIINANNIIIILLVRKTIMISSKIKRSKTPNNNCGATHFSVNKANTTKKAKNIPSQT